ncbi:TPA: hypothetical protein ACH3X1_011430 [Trebouxia sp. C0004]
MMPNARVCLRQSGSAICSFTALYGGSISRYGPGSNGFFVTTAWDSCTVTRLQTLVIAGSQVSRLHDPRITSLYISLTILTCVSAWSQQQILPISLQWARRQPCAFQGSWRS